MTDVMKQIGEVREQLQRSKEQYLEADKNYDSAGVELEDRICDHLNQYLDPKEKRAKRIQDAARDFIAQIREFKDTRMSLASKISFLLIGMDQAIYELYNKVRTTGMEAMNQLLDDVNQQLNRINQATERKKNTSDQESTPSSIDDAKKLLHSQKLEKSMGLIALSAVEIGTKVAKAETLAANLITLRQKTLEAYFGQHVVTDSRVVLQAIEELFRDKTKEEILEKSIEIVGEILQLTGEELDPILKARKIGKDLREKYWKYPRFTNPEGI
jgi:hypothetical protein